MMSVFTPRIILSFDVEEFDTPLEYGKALSMEEQMAVSAQGLQNVLGLLDKHHIMATFFTTANFAQHHPDLLCKIAARHEVASHGYYHSSFEVADLLHSRRALEEIIAKPILGYRMARMMPVDEREIAKAGYVYNSSLHPIWLPGRYNNLHKPRTPFLQHGVWQIPASVTPFWRFPMFWLSFKNFPLSWIRSGALRILRSDREAQVNFYFHPWEFTDVTDRERFGLPFYVSRHSAGEMLAKLERFILWGKTKAQFATFEALYRDLEATLSHHQR